MTQRTTRIHRFLIAGCIAAAAVTLSPDAARANGRFPGATQLVVSGNTASLLTSFGLVTTTDGFVTPRWFCEASLGLDPVDNSGLGQGLFGDGTLMVSSQERLIAAKLGGCSSNVVAGPTGLWFIDVSVSKTLKSHGIAALQGRNQSNFCVGLLQQTSDNGQTWSGFGAPLPNGFCPLTLDYGANEDTLYVSGYEIKPDGVTLAGQLLVSTDRGQTWTVREIPNAYRPFIAAVDPVDPTTLYLRTIDPPSSGDLLVTTNAGVSFRKLATLTGIPLQHFGPTGVAISPDGTRLAYGSVNEGLFVVYDPKSPLATPVKRGQFPVTCLTWTNEGLYACSLPTECRPFVVGRSTDDGATFTPILASLDRVGDTSACTPDTAVGGQCASAWPAVQARLPSCTDAGAEGGGHAPSGASPDAAPGPLVAYGCTIASEDEGPGRGLGAIALAGVVFGGMLFVRGRRAAKAGGRPSSVR